MRYDEFGFEEADEPVLEPEAPHTPMREQFPAAGTDYMGGSSDGWEYRSVFAGSKLAYTFEMVKQAVLDRQHMHGLNLPMPGVLV